MLNRLIEPLSKYIQVRIKLVKLQAREKIEQQIVHLSYLIIVLCIGLCVTNLVFILLAGLINRHLQSVYLGFLIVAAFLFTIFLAVLASGNYVKSKIRQLLLWIFDKS